MVGHIRDMRAFIMMSTLVLFSLSVLLRIDDGIVSRTGVKGLHGPEVPELLAVLLSPASRLWFKVQAILRNTF